MGTKFWTLVGRLVLDSVSNTQLDWHDFKQFQCSSISACLVGTWCNLNVKSGAISISISSIYTYHIPAQNFKLGPRFGWYSTFKEDPIPITNWWQLLFCQRPRLWCSYVNSTCGFCVKEHGLLEMKGSSLKEQPRTCLGC